MEERWFKVGDAPRAGRRHDIARRANARAEIARTGRKGFARPRQIEPVTPKRPDDFEELAKAILKKGGITQPREDFIGPADPAKEQTVRWNSEILFYRNSEIRHRAEIVNTKLRPDLVLCLHFNAEAGAIRANPTLVDKNHLHLLVNGSYLPPNWSLMTSASR